MKVLLIQIVLIAGVLLVAARLLFSRGARTQAVRRLALLAFAAFAVWSILFPSVWNSIARMVGVGRGTDMVLYALVVAFLSYTLTTYVRFRDMEARYTKLARRIALDEAGPATERPGGAAHPTPPSAGSGADPAPEAGLATRPGAAAEALPDAALTDAALPDAALDPSPETEGRPAHDA